MRKVKRKRYWQVSRVYGFVRTRQLEGTMDSGPRTGVFMINAYRVMAAWGVVSEKRWPYPKNEQWPITEPPGLDSVAKFNKLFAYFRVRDLNDARLCLANNFCFCVSVPTHSGWKKAPNGKISLPVAGQPFEENHCVAVVRCDDREQMLLFRNSWGAGWGDKGHGYLTVQVFQQTPSGRLGPPVPISRLPVQEKQAARHHLCGYPLGEPTRVSLHNSRPLGRT
jgi:hypothetical protein